MCLYVVYKMHRKWHRDWCRRCWNVSVWTICKAPLHPEVFHVACAFAAWRWRCHALCTRRDTNSIFHFPSRLHHVDTHTLQVKWFGGRKGWLWCRLANSWIERPEKQFDNQLTLFYLKQPRGRTGDHNESGRYVKTASRFHITGKSEGLRWGQLHSIPWHPLLDNINCSS